MVVDPDHHPTTRSTSVPTRSTTSTFDTKRSRSETDIVTSPSARVTLAVMRIVVGFFFLWAFLDKTFGLRFSTSQQMAWINGGQPAQGFIKGVAANSPFGGAFTLFANPVGDWLFMAGMLGVGMALVLGIGLKVSAIAASALMVSMYLALWPIGTGGTENAATNPLVDLHWVLALSTILFALTRAGDTFGMGKWWARVVGDSWLR